MAPLVLGSKRTAEEVTRGIDLTGRVAVVTGVTHGIGHETMRVLALRGAHVIGTGRSPEKARLACESVEGKTTPAVLDLSDARSVLACVGKVGKLVDAIDIFVCNAGTMASAERELIDGVEKTFVTNHLGHFLLVTRLLSLVTAARAGRIVVVSSDVAHRRWLRGIDFDGLRGRGAYSFMRAYAQSKLANALFSLELSRRLHGTRAVSNALHPGFVRTNIENRSPPVLKWMMKLSGPLLAKNVAQGAATTCYVATHPGLERVSGEFFQNCKPVRARRQMPLTDARLAARLWSFSEGLVRDSMPLGGNGRA